MKATHRKSAVSPSRKRLDGVTPASHRPDQESGRCSSSRSRNAVLLTLVLIAFVLFLVVVLLRDVTFTSAAVVASAPPHTSTRTGGRTMLHPLRKTNEPSLPSFQPMTASDAPVVGTEPGELASSRQPVAGEILSFDSHPTALAIVNLQHIISVLQPELVSEEARTGLLASINRHIAARAVTHRLELVLDVSATNRSGTPVLLTTNGVPDITEEVLQALTP